MPVARQKILKFSSKLMGVSKIGCVNVLRCQNNAESDDRDVRRIESQ